MPDWDERFELLREVGAGGYGTVYQARDARDGTLLAVKVLHMAGAQADARFEREAQTLSELRHPNVVRYLGHGRFPDQRRYLVMEWLEGETLEQRLTRGPLSVPEFVALAGPLLDALRLTEDMRLVHRDLKPGNLFLPEGRLGAVKLLDFGLARHVDEEQRSTRTGMVIGTPLYMSPEQARGERDLDTRADVFSLGCVFYECLVGRAPFAGSTALATLAKVCFDEAARIESARADVPSALADVVHAMLTKAPAGRPGFATLARTLRDMQPLLSQVAAGTVATDAAAAGRAQVSWQRASFNASKEQRVVCAVFVGPSAHALREIQSKLAEQAAGHGARYAQLLDGSSVLMLEGGLAASEQAVIAARCALSLRESLPEAPIVVCTGRAVLNASLPVGELIEQAAKLLADTPPGALRVDDASAGMLDARFEIRGEQGQRNLERERVEGEAPRTLLGQITPFVGRDRELEHLAATFHQCVEDSAPQVVLVTAAAGAGKSRLRYELIQRLRRTGEPFTLLNGRGDAVRRATPLGALGPALRAWAAIEAGDAGDRKQQKLRVAVEGLVGKNAPDLAAFLGEMSGVPFPEDVSPQLAAARKDPQLMGDRLLGSFLDWLEALCACGPVLFAVEDLHWADSASVRFLEAAMRSVGERPLCVLAFARPEIQETFPKLWAERDLVRVHLPKLTPRAQERLLGALDNTSLSAEQRAWVVERAEGNPFVLEELVRALRSAGHVKDVPDSVLGMIQARLDSFGDRAKSVLRAASVFGQAFRVDALESLLGQGTKSKELEGWLQYLTDREVIFPRTGSGTEREYAFRHALMRDAAYALLPETERLLGHRLAGAWLEAHDLGEGALIAEHFEKGGAFEKAAHWYAVAVTRGSDASSVEELVRLAERARACGAEGQTLAEVACVVAEAVAQAGERAQAAAWISVARQRLPEGAPHWWDAVRVQAIGSLSTGNPDAGELIDLLCATSAQSGPCSDQQITTLAEVAATCFVSGRPEWGRKVQGLIPDHALDEVHGRPRVALFMSRLVSEYTRGNLVRCVEVGRVALDEARRSGILRGVSVILNNLGFVLTELGLHEQSEEVSAESATVYRRLGSVGGCAWAQQNLGLAQLRRRNFDQAMRTLGEAAEQGKADPAVTSGCLAYLAWMFTEQGNAARALELSGKATELGASVPTSSALALAVHARALLLGEQPSQALEMAEQAVDLMTRHEVTEHVALMRLAHCEALRANDRHTEAQRAIREAHAWLSQCADRLEDPAIRDSFLTNVPEHARIMELAREYLPAGDA